MAPLLQVRSLLLEPTTNSVPDPNVAPPFSVAAWVTVSAPLIVVVTPDLETLMALALEVPRLSWAAPPASTSSAVAPLDSSCGVVTDVVKFGALVVPTVRVPPKATAPAVVRLMLLPLEKVMLLLARSVLVTLPEPIAVTPELLMVTSPLTAWLTHWLPEPISRLPAVAVVVPKGTPLILATVGFG